MPVPTQRGSPTTTVANVNTTAIVVVVPAGAQVNDLLVMGLAADVIQTVTKPTGWTLARRQTDPSQGNDQTIEAYIRVVDGTEATSYKWLVNNAAQIVAGMVIIQDAKATTTPNAISSQAGTGSTCVAPTISTNAASTLILAFFGTDVSPPGTRTFSSGNMSTEVFDITATSWADLAMYTNPFLSIGATGTRSASTSSGGSNGWISIMMAFEQAGTTSPASSSVVEFYGHMTLMGVM